MLLLFYVLFYCVAAVATRVIRNVYREFFREENYAKYQRNVAVELGRKRGPKVVAKIETRYTQAAYDLVVKELSNKRYYVGNARELLEKFITILIRNGVIRHYPIYEKCWIVVDWSNCEFAELIARFSKIISAKEDKRVKWSLFNTILISKHNGPFDDIRKQYSWGNGLKDSRQVDIENKNYTHYKCDVRDKEALPDIDEVEILINNAGTQNEEDIDINLKALIYITEKYALQPNIKSVLNIGSASGHTGAEFPEYCASKGGVLAYTKNVAMRVAKYGATCNSLDPGGVLTPLNDCVINDADLWEQIMNETPLRRWATTKEIAQWAYFLTVTNKFCTGQNILVDGGESINYNFIWKE